MLSTTCRRVKQISPRIVSVRFAHTTSTPTEQDPTEYCKNFIRQHDYESFLIGQFWPKNVQGGYFALKAFSVRWTRIWVMSRTDEWSPGRAGDDTGHSLQCSNWTDEDAVLERCDQGLG